MHGAARARVGAVVVAAATRFDPGAGGLVVDGLLDDLAVLVEHRVLVGVAVAVGVDERLAGAVLVLDDRGVVDAVLVEVVVELGLVLLAVNVDSDRLRGASLGVRAAALVDPWDNPLVDLLVCRSL